MGTTDSLLLQRWTEHRDAEAFAALVRRHAGMVYGTSRRILRNDADAEEVAQECFAELLRPERVNAVRSLGGWLHTLATHRALDRLRQDMRRRHREEAAGVGAITQVDAPCVSALQAEVDEAIATLEEDLRAPIILHFLEGRTHREVASMLGLPRTTVTSRIARGIEAIRETLEQRGVVVSVATLGTALAALCTQAAPPGLVAGLGKLALAGGGKVSVAAAGTTLAGVKLPSLAWIAAALLLIAGLATPTLKQLLLSSQEKTVDEAGMNVNAPEVAQGDANPGLESESPGEVATVGERDSRLYDLAESILSSAESKSMGSISGKVLDVESGAPLDAVVVMLSMQDSEGAAKEIESATTTDSGAYAFTGLEAGTYQVAAKRGMSITSAVRPDDSPRIAVPIKGGENVEGIDLAIDPGLVVSGVVTDRTGRPLSGASIGLAGTQHHGAYDGTSGEDGAFRIRVFEPGEYPVFTRMEGHARKLWPPVKVNEEDIGGLAYVLDPESVIEGIVLDAAGRPAKKVTVFAEIEGWHPCVTRTKADGTFRLTELLSGEVGLVLSESGSVGDNDLPVAMVALGVGQSVRGMRLVFDTSERLQISGHIRNSDGEPIANAEVFAHDGGFTESDQEGHFQFAGMLAGEYYIDVEHPEYSPIRLQSIPAGTTDLDIVLAGRGAVEGLVLTADTHMPVASAQIYAISGRHHGIGVVPDSSDAVASVDADGAYRLGGLQEGVNTVLVRAQGFALGRAVVEAVSAEETIGGIDIHLESGGRIEGTVVDTLNTPVAKAHVFHDKGGMQILNGNDALAVTDNEGRFVIEGMPATAISLVASKDGFAPGRAIFDTSGEGSVRIVLGEDGRLRGKITRGGQPLRRAGVSVTRETSPKYNQHTSTDDSGEYEIHGLLEGVYTASISYGAGTANLEAIRQAEILTGQATVLDVDLPLGDVSLSGMVTHADGSPIAGARLILRHLGDGHSLSTYADVGGHYFFADAVSGPSRLEVRENRYSGQPVWRSIVLPSSDSQVCDVVFDAGTHVACDLENLPNFVEWLDVLVLGGGTAVPSTEEELNWIQREALSWIRTRKEGLVTYIAEPGPYTLLGMYSVRNETGIAVSQLESTSFARAEIVVDGQDEIQVVLRFP